MKPSTEYSAFTNLVDRVLSVPHSIVKQRVEEQRKQSASSPSKPGPKPKPKRKLKKPSA
jgi:hypothetical protein